MTASPPAEPGGPNDPAYAWRLLRIVLVGSVVFGSTMTIIGASLAEIAEALDTTQATLSWALTAPFLGLAAGTTLSGSLGDMYGHRRMLIIGLALLAVATGLSGLAWNAVSFIVFRLLVGVGGAMMLPNGNALMLAAFNPRDRARAMGWFQFAAVGGPTFGLFTGGALVDALGWRAVFAVYTPIAALGLVAVVLVVRPGTRSEPKPLDMAGAATLVTAVVALMLGLSQGTARGFSHPLPLGLLLATPVAVAAFVAVESRSAHPMVPLEWFGLPNFSGPIVASAASNAAYMGGFVLTPLLLQERYGYSLTAATMVLVTRLLSFTLASPVGGFLARTRGERFPVMVGTLLVVLAMAAFLGSALTSAVALVILGLGLSGAGLGTAGPAYQVALAGTVPLRELGAATGMFQMSTSLGTAVGIQVLVLAKGEESTSTAFANGFWVGMAIATIGVLGALAVRPSSAAFTN